MEQVGEFGEDPMFPAAPLAVDHHEVALIARLGRMLGDQIVRQIKVEFRDKHTR